MEPASARTRAAARTGQRRSPSQDDVASPAVQRSVKWHITFSFVGSPTDGQLVAVQKWLYSLHAIEEAKVSLSAGEFRTSSISDDSLFEVLRKFAKEVQRESRAHLKILNNAVKRDSTLPVAATEDARRILANNPLRDITIVTIDRETARPITDGIAPAQGPSSTAEFLDDLRSKLENAGSDPDEQAFIAATLTDSFAEHTRQQAVETVSTLGRIAAVATQIDKLRDDLDRLVHEARTNGATWVEIGKATGIRPESAMRRWDAKARKKHNEYQRAYQRDRTSGSPSAADDK